MTDDISLTDSQPTDLPELPGRYLTAEELLEVLESLDSEVANNDDDQIDEIAYTYDLCNKVIGKNGGYGCYTNSDLIFYSPDCAECYDDRRVEP